MIKLNRSIFRDIYKLKLLVLLICPLITFSQNKNVITQNIQGIITDQVTGEGIAGVLIETGDIQTSTNEKGIFILTEIPIGRHSITFSKLGYKTHIIKELPVGPAKEVQLDLALSSQPIELAEVVIQPKVNKSSPLNDKALLGAQMFSVEEASRFAGGMDDPARLISAYAGITPPSISNNGISVRGNTPALLQWRLEGIEIPNPNHFADLDVLGGGFLSALSSNVLGTSDFLVGAFPAEYSNAISGVFDMKLRNGNRHQHEHTFQVGMLGIDFASEGPINRNQSSSYTVNYRYSTTKLLEKIGGKEQMGGTLGYQDLNFKLSFPSKKAGVFSLWGVGLIDEVDPILVDPKKWMYREEGSLAGAKQKSGASGLSHKYSLKNRKTSVHTTLAVTYMGNRAQETLHDEEGGIYPQTKLATNTTNFVFTSSLRHKFNSRHSNSTGITLRNIKYDMNFDLSSEPEEPLKNYAQAIGNTQLLSAYTHSKINLAKDFILSAGLNTQYLSLNKQITIEPRASLKWETSPQSSLALGYGLHSRMESADVYFVKADDGSLPNKALGFTKSHHFMLAYEYRLSPDMHLKVEPYYQFLYKVPVSVDHPYSLLNRQEYYITQPLVNDGEGRNFGIDLSLQKYFTKNMYYMITASLFDSRYKTQDGHWYNTRYNRKFIVNGLIGKEWSLGSNIFGINLKASLLGGNRYTPVDEEATLAHPNKEIQYNDSYMFAKQFSPMFVGDFTVSYTINRKRVAHEFAIKSVNAMKQKEYVEHRYNIRTHTIEPYRPATSLFNVSYRIEF